MAILYIFTTSLITGNYQFYKTILCILARAKDDVTISLMTSLYVRDLLSRGSSRIESQLSVLALRLCLWSSVRSDKCTKSEQKRWVADKFRKISWGRVKKIKSSRNLIFIYRNLVKTYKNGWKIIAYSLFESSKTASKLVTEEELSDLTCDLLTSLSLGAVYSTVVSLN